MLAALQNGVRGGKWFTLIDKVHSKKVLLRAFELVRSNRGAAGVDGQSIAAFEADLDRNLAELVTSVRLGTYQPLPVRRVYIPKANGKQRPLGIPAVRDRVVQAALRMVIEPIFEQGFSDTSFGFRPGRSAQLALDRVESLLASGHTHVVDVDIQQYFDSIPRAALMSRVETKVADGKVLALLRAFLTQRVMEDGVARWTPAGTPQGAVISPLLANLYLDPLDHLLRASGFEAIRYADDMVVMCRDAAQAQAALTLLQNWMASAGLVLHPEKTRVVDAAQEVFEFLGYRFSPRWREPRDASRNRFKDSIRARTKRTNGTSLSTIIVNLNRVIRGWGRYFWRCSHWVLHGLDKLIRRRLRALLCKRNGHRGGGHGLAHSRWPNSFFEAQGLVSLLEVRASCCPVR